MGRDADADPNNDVEGWEQDSDDGSATDPTDTDGLLQARSASFNRTAFYRKSLEFHPRVRTMLTKLWAGVDSEAQRCIEEKQYIELRVHIAKAMDKKCDETKTRHTAANDWALDSLGYGFLDYERFTLVTFRLAERYRAVVQAEDYARFLDKVNSVSNAALKAKNAANRSKTQVQSRIDDQEKQSAVNTQILSLDAKNSLDGFAGTSNTHLDVPAGIVNTYPGAGPNGAPKFSGSHTLNPVAATVKDPLDISLNVISQFAGMTMAQNDVLPSPEKDDVGSRTFVAFSGLSHDGDADASEVGKLTASLGRIPGFEPPSNAENRSMVNMLQKNEKRLHELVDPSRIDQARQSQQRAIHKRLQLRRMWNRTTSKTAAAAIGDAGYHSRMVNIMHSSRRSSPPFGTGSPRTVGDMHMRSALNVHKHEAVHEFERTKRHGSPNSADGRGQSPSLGTSFATTQPHTDTNTAVSNWGGKDHQAETAQKQVDVEAAAQMEAEAAQQEVEQVEGEVDEVDDSDMVWDDERLLSTIKANMSSMPSIPSRQAEANNVGIGTRNSSNSNLMGRGSIKHGKARAHYQAVVSKEGGLDLGLTTTMNGSGLMMTTTTAPAFHASEERIDQDPAKNRRKSLRRMRYCQDPGAYDPMPTSMASQPSSRHTSLPSFSFGPKSQRRPRTADGLVGAGFLPNDSVEFPPEEHVAPINSADTARLNSRAPCKDDARAL
jgi:hypothetical protein